MILSRIAAILLITVSVPIQTMHSFEQKEQVSDAVIRINVDLVQVDAVVVDSQENPATDLQAEDFNIYQDGRLQKITNFSFVRTRDSGEPAVSVTQTAIHPQNEPPVPLSPPKQLKASQVRSIIVLVADDLALSWDSTIRVRQALKKWLDTAMQAGDLVAVVRTAVGISAMQQLTSDKRSLHAAIERIRFNVQGSRVGTTSFAPLDPLGKEPGAVDTERFIAENERLSTMASLNTIRYVVNGLKDLPGRKSLVIFSENMKNNFGIFQGEQTVEKPVRDLIESAHRSSVVIHIIDPRGVVYTGITAEDNVDYMEADEIAKTDENRYTALVESQNYMPRITGETGGLFITNTNDLTGGLKRAVDDGNGYYLIGYQPDASTVEEMTKGRPKLHSIRVRVKRRGLHVRSRSRFLSIPSQDTVSKPLSQKEQIEKALESPFTDETVPVRLTPLFVQTQEGKPAINALLHFDASKLSFSTTKDNWYEANVDLVAAILDADGLQVDIAYKKGTIQAKGEAYKNMLKSGVAFLMNVPVKNPGAYIMRVVMYDNKSGQLGSATQFVDIPDINGKKLALSGIMLAADAFKPEDFNQKEGVIAYENSNGTAAVRIFEPGETIAWACQILNAKTDNHQKPRLEVRGRLFREEQEITAGKASEITTKAEKDTARIIAMGKIKLTQLPQGHYTLQVIVLDTLADKDHRMAVQSMDFEIASKAGGSAGTQTLSQQYAPAESITKSVVDMTSKELCKFDRELSHLKFDPNQKELANLLEKVGDKVVAFFRDFSNTSSKEKVKLLRYKKISPFEANRRYGYTLKENRIEEFNYLILPGSGKAGISWIEDRTDKKNRPVTQKALRGFIMSSGYASLCIYLHPAHQANSRFRYLGRDQRKSHPHVIAFAQKPEAGEYLAQYYDVSSSIRVRYLVHGFVWIDAESYQILRIRTNMLSLEKPAALKKTSTDVRYGRVKFKGNRQEFWLPKRVDISWEFPDWNYSNRHEYSDYHQFSVASDYEISQPGK